MTDPAFSYWTLAALLKHEPWAFHWNRYISSGIPGFGTFVSGMLSPFILAPALLLPLRAFFSAVILLKINLGFLLAYLWLRQERAGKIGATAGALDGQPQRVIPVHGLFAGLLIPPGRHRIDFDRKLGRDFWWLSGLGLVAMLALPLVSRRLNRHEG